MTNEKLDDCCAMAVVHQVYPVPGTDASNRFGFAECNRFAESIAPNRFAESIAPNRFAES